MQALSDEYYVVFFDQRGSGLSPRVDQEEITLESAIADLDAIVEYFDQGEKVNSGLLSNFLKTKYEALHVNWPDEHASDDYFGHQINLYQGSDHP